MSFSPVRQRMPHGVLAARKPRVNTTKQQQQQQQPRQSSDGSTTPSYARARRQPEVRSPSGTSAPFVRTAREDRDLGPTHEVPSELHFLVGPAPSPAHQQQQQQQEQQRTRRSGAGRSTPQAAAAFRAAQTRSTDKTARQSGRPALGSTARLRRSPSPADGGAAVPTAGDASDAAARRRRAKRAPGSGVSGSSKPKSKRRVRLRVNTKSKSSSQLTGGRRGGNGAPVLSRTPNSTVAMPVITSPSARQVNMVLPAPASSPSKQTPLAKHLKRRTMGQWLRMYDQEHGTFQSTAVEVESRLRRARVYGGNDVMPNHLLTAVAFEGLGQMVGHFGAYKHLVQEVLGAFREAVFTDAPAVETDVLAAADAGRHGVEVYYDAIPYYQKCAELSKAIAAIKLERDTMETELKRVTQRAAEEVEKAHSDAKKHIKEQLLDASREKTLMMEQLRAATRALQTFKTKRAEESSVEAADSVRADFLRVPLNEQAGVLADLLDQLTPENSIRMCIKAMRRMRGDDVVKVVSDAMNTNKRVTVAHAQDVVDNIMQGRRVLEQADGQRVVVRGTVRRCMKSDERETVIQTTVEALTNRQRQGLMRFLCNLDQSLLLRWKRNTIDKGRRSLTSVVKDAEQLSGKAEASKAAKAKQALLEAGASNVISSLSHTELLEVLRLSQQELSDLEKYRFLQSLLEEWGLKHAFEYTPPADADKADEDGAGSDGPRGAGNGPGATADGSTAADGGTAGEVAGEVAGATIGSSEMATADAVGSAGTHGSGKHGKLSALPGSLRDLLRSLDPTLLAELVPCQRPCCLADEGDDGEGGSGKSGKGGKKRRRRRGKGGRGGGGAPAGRFPPGHPMNKYSRRTRKANKQKLKITNVLTLVYDCYEKKILADEVDDREKNPRDGFPVFMRDFLLHKYGLPSICDSYMFGIVECLEKHAHKNKRLGVFAQLMGFSGSNQLYLDRTGDVALNMIKKCFPKFTAATFRTRKVGSCLVHLQVALDAVEFVFPVISSRTMGRVWAGERMPLTEARYFALVQAVVNASFKYSDLEAIKKARTQEGQGGAAVSGAEDGDGAGAGAGAGAAGSRRKRSRGSSGTKGRKGKGGKGDLDEIQFQPIDYVVDFDGVLVQALDTFWDQLNANIEGLKVLYTEFDEDHNGILSLEEFKSLIAACVSRPMAPRHLMTLFKEVTGGALDDTVTADAFAVNVAKKGLVPPQREERPRRKKRSSVQLSSMALQHLRAVDAGLRSGPFDPATVLAPDDESKSTPAPAALRSAASLDVTGSQPGAATPGTSFSAQALTSFRGVLKSRGHAGGDEVEEHILSPLHQRAAAPNESTGSMRRAGIMERLST